MIVYVAHTSTKGSITSTGVGLRPGKGDCAADAPESSVVSSILLRFLVLHTLLAFSSAVENRFLDFSQERWCLASALG